jgi:perosamine synthetase
MNREPVSVSLGTDMQEIRQIMLRDELKQIPVLDLQGKIVDIVTMSTLLRIPLSNPDITYREVQAVLDVLATPNLSLGPKMFEFEEKFAQYVGARFAVSVNSGTSGLHLCIKSLGIGEGDEVITTPFSFIASSNCILFERATPVFVDIDPRTYNIDVSEVERKITPRTKAILPVHVFGHPCEIERLRELAEKHKVFLIEDSCEAIGAEYRGRKVGTFGDCSVFSFYPNKQMTTSEGGVIVTDNPDVAGLCRSYRNQGRGDKGGWLAH